MGPRACRDDVASTWLRSASPVRRAPTSALLPDDDDVAVLRTHEERFADLVHRQHHRFAHLAFMLCGDRTQAEDVVADAYVRVWPKFRKDRVDDPGAYVRRVVVNQIRGGFRRRLLERREERASRSTSASRCTRSRRSTTGSSSGRPCSNCP